MTKVKARNDDCSFRFRASIFIRQLIFVIRHLAGRWSFPNELADLLEFRRARTATPFEKGGFDGCERGPGRIHSAESDVVVDLAAGGGGVSRHVNAKALAQQIVYRLTD